MKRPVQEWRLGLLYSRPVVRWCREHPVSRVIARRIGALLVVLSISACSTPAGELPEIPKPLDYNTTHVDLPGCAVGLPPVHDIARCSPDDIGRRLDAEEICRLLTGLKAWAGPARWGFARSSCVYDAIAEWPHRPGHAPRRVLTLYVEVPARSEVWFAQQTEGQPTIDYFVSPR